ncbi:unnamed protein product [Sphagnum troendelagicum]|uniref:Uncharacterized protein n=1 Tax=Sphagnum troendelagicum TaxID=128251 RepID=A0ABP0T7T9_9BRYO
MAKVVKKIPISWPNFGHETNTNQQGKWQSQLDTLIAKKASILGMDVVEVYRELKVHGIVKVEKGIKAECEPTPIGFGKVGEINPWIEKKNEVVELVQVANELEVAKLELDSKNKDKECFRIKMEHINGVHESMTSMKEKEEKKLQDL